MLSWFFAIVPADLIGTPEASDAERVPVAGVALFMVSFVSMALPIGILGRLHSFIITPAMLVLAIVAIPWLYPDFAVSEYPGRLVAQTATIVLLLFAYNSAKHPSEIRSVAHRSM